MPKHAPALDVAALQAEASREGGAGGATPSTSTSPSPGSPKAVGTPPLAGGSLGLPVLGAGTPAELIGRFDCAECSSDFDLQ